MKKLVLSFLLVCFITSSYLFAQDTLPKFSVTNAGNNRIIVGWTNTYDNVRQISIQRSFDSLTGYKSIMTVPDPSTLQNGYVDTKATNDHMFYRLYIMFDKGMYTFSKPKRPYKDTTRRTTTPVTITGPDGKIQKAAADSNKLNGVDVGDVVGLINAGDSIGIPGIGISNKPKPPVFTPSLHVYTYKDGNIRINLPEEENKKYAIKFFEENNDMLFELKDIKERTFSIDKAIFLHSGWFKFELYEDGKLKEKHKFFLQKDF
ncbi:MAG: hypothetical protein JNJ86_02020 [Chitinophagaceae bacterium]|nr:hypothetical protein [Chitinophagaceae bacterium]